MQATVCAFAASKTKPEVYEFAARDMMLARNAAQRVLSHSMPGRLGNGAIALKNVILEPAPGKQSVMDLMQIGLSLRKQQPKIAHARSL